MQQELNKIVNGLKVVNTVYSIFFNNRKKVVLKKIRWYEYNKFKKVKSNVTMNNLQICRK